MAYIDLKDGNNQRMRIAAETGDTTSTFRAALEVDGSLVSITNPLPVRMSGGSTGYDFSGNVLSVPITDYVLAVTVPVSLTRSNIEVQNQDLDTIQVVRDDGDDMQQSIILLAPGNIWSSSTFLGRLKIYASTTDARIAVYVD